MSTPDEPTMSHDSLDALIAAYMLSVEAGEVPNRQKLLDQHPEQAEWLANFFADLDRMDRVAAPLRLAENLDETSGAEGQGTHGTSSIRYFGDYELLEEIARGGMGVVFKARQTSLNRMVALKMILGGTFATDKDVARFRAEAEAAANLDHPHIVPIYEVGEHDRQQYYAMKFVEGTSLARQPRVDARGEVTAMLNIIRAVHHAHQRGVLHRDLKPSNVLVDSQGTRFVTDFGLAKRLENKDKSLTEQGQVLGTPRYMSPEQASGRKDLTVAADVYSLGVILYERLTGETPFKAENVLTLLRQVRDQPPARPSAVAPNIDRDLETVVLKCLDKDPTRRYPSAESLADDLTRWLKAEPILARHVGQAERALLWCRRNPVVSGLAATVAASLLIGITGSAFFAVRERRARDLAEVARQQADEARDDMEGHLARGLAKPLELAPLPYKTDELSVPETESLWELASLGQTNIGVRFLAEATDSPFSTQQLCARAEPALIAAIGSDQTKRKLAIELLTRHLHDPKRSSTETGDLAFVALELVDRPGPLSEMCADSIMAVLDSKPSDTVRRRWFGELDAGFGTIAERSQNEWLTSSLQRMETRVSPRKSAEILIAAQTLETDTGCRGRLRRELRAVELATPAIESRSVCRQACAMYSAALNQDDVIGNQIIGNAEEAAAELEFFAVRLDPMEAADVLTEALERDLAREIHNPKPLTWIEPEHNIEFYADSRYYLSDGIIKVSSNLPATEAKAARARAIKTLNRYLDRQIHGIPRWAIARQLSTLSSSLPAREAADFLTRRLESESDGDACNFFTQGLLAACLRMETSEASLVRKRTSDILFLLIDRNRGERQQWPLKTAISSVAKCMTTTEAVEVAKTLTATTVAQAAEEQVRRAMLYGPAVSLIARRLNATEAQAVCAPVTQVLIKALTENLNKYSVARSLALVALRLQPPDSVNAMRLIASVAKRPATRAGLEEPFFSSWYDYDDETINVPDLLLAARVHMAAIDVETDVDARWWLCASLSQLAAAMPPEEAGRLGGHVAQCLIDAFNQPERPISELSIKGIIKVLAGVGSKPLAQFAEKFVDAFWKEPAGDRSVERIISVLAGVGPEHLTYFANKFIDQINDQLQGPKSDKVVARVITSIVEHMPPQDGRDVARRAADAIRSTLKSRGFDPECSAESALVVVAQLLDAKECSNLLSEVLIELPQDFGQQALAEGLVAATKKLTQLEEFELLVSTLDRACGGREGVAKQSWDRNRMVLARNVCALIASLKSDIGSRARAKARRVVVKSCGLEDLWLNGESRDQVAAVLNQLIVGLGSRDIQWEMIQVLTEEGFDARLLKDAVTCTSGPKATDDKPLPSLPFPCLLTTQDLVELLKMPTIFGETRQVVLAALGNRYSRRFTNHWQFVRFAKERKLDLDFTTPPKRPNPAKSREAIIKALKGEQLPG